MPDCLAMPDCLDSFALAQRRRNLSEVTIDKRWRVLNGFHIWYGDCPIPATRDDIERWLDTRSITARSRGTYLASLDAFYDWAVDDDQLAANPVSRIVRPRTRRTLPRPIADADLERAWMAGDARMRAWIALGALAGLRCKEIAGLRREDVMEQRDAPVLVVSAGKGGHEGIIPLHPTVLSSLRVYGLPKSGWVFHMENGHPYLPGTVSTYVGRHLRDLGINATAHQLRHWFATKLWADSHDMRMTQELMRHADPRTTAVYTAWDQVAAARAVGGLHLR